jgi:hypothetical protein
MLDLGSPRSRSATTSTRCTAAPNPSSPMPRARSLGAIAGSAAGGADRQSRGQLDQGHGHWAVVGAGIATGVVAASDGYQVLLKPGPSSPSPPARTSPSSTSARALRRHRRRFPHGRRTSCQRTAHEPRLFARSRDAFRCSHSPSPSVPSRTVQPAGEPQRHHMVGGADIRPGSICSSIQGAPTRRSAPAGQPGCVRSRSPRG